MKKSNFVNVGFFVLGFSSLVVVAVNGEDAGKPIREAQEKDSIDAK